MEHKTTIDQNKLKAFVFDNILPSTRGAMSIIMAIIGDQLGLFKAMNNHGPVTADRLAKYTGLPLRYLQEWLSALAAARWIDYEPKSKEFTLTPEQATVFIDSNSLMYFQGVFGIVAACHLDLAKIISAFKSGEGIPWKDREKCLFCSITDSLSPKYKNQLILAWLPKISGIIPKLESGAKVADLGCGTGLTTLLMAEAFPHSEFYGFDLHADSIEQAKIRAVEMGLTNVTFQVCSVKDYPGNDYDLICYFECLHDLGDPVGACQYAKRTLKHNGCILLVEPTANDHLEENFGDINAISYAMSTCICTPTSLAQEVGLALGAQAGPAKIQQVTTEAGFSHFEVVYKTMSHMVIHVS